MSKLNISRYKKVQYAQWGILIAMLIVLLGIGFGFLLQLLWNIVIVDVFNVGPISFWQAVGLFVIAKLFFGFGVGGNRHGHRDKKRWAKKFSRRDSAQESTSQEGASGDDVSLDNSSLEQDADFKEFWSAEGKTAYEAYRESHKG